MDNVNNAPIIVIVNEINPLSAIPRSFQAFENFSVNVNGFKTSTVKLEYLNILALRVLLAISLLSWFFRAVGNVIIEYIGNVNNLGFALFKALIDNSEFAKPEE